MSEIEGKGEAFTAQLLEAAKQETERIAREWWSKADRKLLRRGDQAGYEVYPLVQGSVWEGWNEDERAWEFAYPHEAAIYFEEGTDPHTVEATNADWLAFEWPEMEGEPFGDTGMTFDEVFSETWPTVFFKEVEVEGVEALHFLRDSWKEVDSV